MKTKVISRVIDQLPNGLEALFNNLSFDEKKQLLEVSPSLVAKIYQSGAIFALNLVEAE